MTGTRFFDRGIEHVTHSHLPSHRVGDSESRWLAEWAEFCLDTGLSVANSEGNRWLPQILSYSADGGFEVFDVTMRGLLGMRTDLLTEMLLTCRDASTVTTMELRPGVIRIVLNHHQLPDTLAFNPDRVPDSPDQVYLGVTGLGGDLVWDTRHKYHGLIVGESGGGKTEAAALALTQFHRKGWELIIITPTTDDTAFQAFTNAGHSVITGFDHDDVVAANEVLGEQRARMVEREQARAAAGSDWFEGRPSLLVLDESGDSLEDRKHEPPETRTLKAENRAAVDLRARRGRKIRQHLLVITQEPYVHNFGTPETLRQLSFRLAVTGLDQTFQPVVFQRHGDNVSPNVRRVLSNAQSPVGRGIARGAYPSGPFPVDEVPVQVAWAPPEQRAALINPDRLVAV